MKFFIKSYKLLPGATITFSLFKCLSLVSFKYPYLLMKQTKILIPVEIYMDY